VAKPVLLVKGVPLRAERQHCAQPLGLKALDLFLRLAEKVQAIAGGAG
jgi:hypothetical protein